MKPRHEIELDLVGSTNKIFYWNYLAQVLEKTGSKIGFKGFFWRRCDGKKKIANMHKLFKTTFRGDFLGASAQLGPKEKYFK